MNGNKYASLLWIGFKKLLECLGGRLYNSNGVKDNGKRLLLNAKQE